ncbi:murein transglycosylase A [Temperatibacter marinus]|uniref:peptidoglycan lytic exotransglycosylase n=1 Tax=Temperatibacter marinus TaxID=1456591 RepID=A0AA52EHE5_9PROT|nr:murein transglycosylase A [Temperatibacter marinus]WND03703.1 murein transglycosylase A [Temperatibacter marinus]
MGQKIHNNSVVWLSFVLVLMAAALSIFLLKKESKGLNFHPVAFTQLQGWQGDKLTPALKAFQTSCKKLILRPAKRSMGAGIGGTVGDWHPACKEALILNSSSSEEARSFFEKNFQPFSVAYDDRTEGVFTGYYEPLLQGSYKQSKRYSTPLLARPQELVMVDLGTFRHDLKGRRIAGRVEKGRLVPYPDRKAIDAGALNNKTEALLWVDDPVMAFSLHIQGSGRVQMEDGSIVRIGYAAQNGHPYRAIGRVMVQQGLLERSQVSMPAIQNWLRENPARANEIMHTNPSYVFLRLIGGDGPYGSAGVVLTPRRSLAVDRKHLPLNVPMYLDASHPDPTDRNAPSLPFQRLMITQDTGGAIRGGIRGDVFWGFGGDAEEIAGRMANKGRYYILLPKALAQQVNTP